MTLARATRPGSPPRVPPSGTPTAARRAAATVDLPSLRLTAIQVCLGVAVSSGVRARGGRAAHRGRRAHRPDLAKLATSAATASWSTADPRGTLQDTRTT